MTAIGTAILIELFTQGVTMAMGVYLLWKQRK